MDVTMVLKRKSDGQFVVARHEHAKITHLLSVDASAKDWGDNDPPEERLLRTAAHLAADPGWFASEPAWQDCFTPFPTDAEIHEALICDGKIVAIIRFFVSPHEW